MSRKKFCMFCSAFSFSGNFILGWYQCYQLNYKCIDKLRFELDTTDPSQRYRLFTSVSQYLLLCLHMIFGYYPVYSNFRHRRLSCVYRPDHLWNFWPNLSQSVIRSYMRRNTITFRSTYCRHLPSNVFWRSKII